MSLVRENKSDQGSLIRISINKYFFHYAHDADCDFNFFGGDVFSLSKFKYIFFPVYNLNGSVWLNHDNVASVQPALCVDGLVSFLKIPIIPRKDAGSSDAALSSRTIYAINNVF